MKIGEAMAKGVARLAAKIGGSGGAESAALAYRENRKLGGISVAPMASKYQKRRKISARRKRLIKGIKLKWYGESSIEKLKNNEMRRQ
jgi:hypothetical protein